MDWNDIHRDNGADATRRAFDEAHGRAEANGAAYPGAKGVVLDTLEGLVTLDLPRRDSGEP